MKTTYRYSFQGDRKLGSSYMATINNAGLRILSIEVYHNDGWRYEYEIDLELEGTEEQFTLLPYSHVDSNQYRVVKTNEPN